MIWYWILLYTILFFCIIDLFELSIRPIYKKCILGGLLFLLGSFAGLRYECDNDYLEYIRIYNQVPTISDFFSGGYNLSDIYGEPLFVFTNIFLKTFGAADYVYLSFVAFANVFFLYKTIIGFSKYWFLTLFLYVSLLYLGGGFTQIRFGIAMTLSWYGLLQYFKGNIKFSAVLICCAIMFHVSAAIVLIVYIANRYLTLNTFIVLFVIVFSIFLSIFSFGDLLGRVLGVILGDSRYAGYLTSEVYAEKANSFATFFYILNVLIFWFSKESVIKRLGEERFIFLFKIALISLFFGALFGQMAFLARFSLILQYCYIFILPHTLGLRPLRFLLLMVMILYGIFRFNQFLGEDSFIQEYQNVVTAKWLKK